MGKIKAVEVTVTRVIGVGRSYNISGSDEYAGLSRGVVEVKAICSTPDLPNYIDLYAYEQFIEEDYATTQGTDINTWQWVGFQYRDASLRDDEDIEYLPLDVFSEHISQL